MLKIWGRADSGNVQKVTWAVGELGLPFERTDVGGKFGQLDEAWYRKLNPNSRIPTIEDDGLVLWESNAIVRHLALKHGKGGLCPADPAARADADRWMDWCTTTQQPPMAVLFIGLVRTPPEKRDARTMEAIEEARLKMEGLAGVLDARLATRPFLAGDQLSIGDIPLGVFVHRWYGLPIQRPAGPHLDAWYARLRDRPAFREHVLGPG